MIEQKTDILIVGGGPAGSTTALYLSQLGFDITVIEKKKFPRETLCGEFLSKEVVEVMKDLNIFQDFLSLNPNSLKSFCAIDESGIELRSVLKFDAYAMKRSVFDSFLLDKARARNVKVIQPAEVISITKTKSGFISEIVDENSRNYNIRSKLVIAAYGKQNILDKKLERDFIHKKSNLNGVKFHFPITLLKDSFRDEIRIYTDDELYVGMNQVNENEITVCFLENRKQSKIPSRKRIIEVIKAHRHFQNIFKEEAIDYIETTIIYGTGNIFFGRRAVIENEIIMVGDAARVISPLAGDGIGMAMETAQILYSILSKNNISNIGKIFLEYQKQFEKVFSKRLKTARVIQNIILNRNTRKICFTLSSKYPALLPYLIKFTRSYKTA